MSFFFCNFIKKGDIKNEKWGFLRILRSVKYSTLVSHQLTSRVVIFRLLIFFYLNIIHIITDLLLSSILSFFIILKLLSSEFQEKV